MLYYDLSDKVEAFSTNIEDAIDFDVVLPLHQAHSALVRRIPQEQDDITGVDALITNEKGVRIGVKTADCVPVLLYDKGREAVAAIHSGWKGTVQNIIGETIKKMTEEFQTCPSDILAVIGPCIHLEAFEVGDEVYERFAAMLELRETGVPARKFKVFNVPKDLKDLKDLKEKWHIDLPEVCRIELLQSGVKAENIEVRPECTYTLPHRFFSARRLGKAFDRQRIVNTIKLKNS